MSANEERPVELVRALIAGQKLPASDTEIERLVSAYVEQKAISEMLFAVDEARYESSALQFGAEPIDANWWEEAN